jgi:hypothetical protein
MPAPHSIDAAWVSRPSATHPLRKLTRIARLPGAKLPSGLPQSGTLADTQRPSRPRRNPQRSHRPQCLYQAAHSFKRFINGSHWPQINRPLLRFLCSRHPPSIERRSGRPRSPCAHGLNLCTQGRNLFRLLLVLGLLLLESVRVIGRSEVRLCSRPVCILHFATCWPSSRRMFIPLSSNSLARNLADRSSAALREAPA